MRSRGILAAVCVLAALSAVACGTDDDSPSDGGAGSGGKNSAGSGGKNSAGSGGKNSSGAGGGGATAGGGGDIGQGGEGGVGPGNDCVQFSTFVHTVIKEDTNAKSAPRPVNDIVFCNDPADPAAYNDLL